jgi:hypothetical protein
MTQLLSLLNHVFGHQARNHDLEHFITSHNPDSHEQLETLTREYIYHHTTLRGLWIMNTIRLMIDDLIDAWVEAKSEQAKHFHKHHPIE